MFDIVRGDRGPRIVALQILINRLIGARTLDVDGIFGPQTEEGVGQAQHVLGLPMTGEVDPETWERLLEPTDLVVINHADIYDPARERVMPDELWYDPYLNMVGGMSGGLLDMCRRIRVLAGTNRILMVRLFGHGRDGLIGITGGDGRLRDSDGEPILDMEKTRETGKKVYVRTDHEQELSILTTRTLARLRHEFRRLRPLFVPFGSMELHACSVGKGPRGRQLLQSLSNMLRIPVSGGMNKQKFGTTTASRFEGEVRTCYPPPFRTLRRWSHHVRCAHDRAA